MKTRWSMLILVLTIAFGVLVSTARADVVVFKDGGEVNGIIRKVADGKVVIDLSGEEKVFDIINISSMDFTTPHLVTTEHFSKDIEAQEVVANIRDLEKAAAEIRFKLSQIQGYWGKKGSVTPAEESGWLAAREEFRKPLTLYQEVLNDLYFHVLAKVDEYNGLTRDARKVYVGVKGPFNVGSSLIPNDLERLPLRKYVPATWWDTIYFNGYNMGYEDAVRNQRSVTDQPPTN
jgi:hypothetical protein